ncbi:protein CLT2, chloroplastic-like [Phragmites australis]|uniref:protein CLT2, chloroplastic-like n=1 Tax=Phragmites australis TaxID=29695 RepID=UPI002D796114|nr:protein CLT2, chloroplastic-like [Phragmites australis]
MSVSHLLSPSSHPSPPPPLLRGAPRRCPTPLRAAVRLPAPRRVGLTAARGYGRGRFFGMLGSRSARAATAFRVSAIAGDGGGGGGTGIAAAVAATVVLAVMNRVLYKLALVPMRNYPFFLAQFTTFGYVLVYFSILFIRYRAGIVTREMLALPKSQFMLIGLLEALGVASGMAAAAMLPGPSIPVLSQSFLVWQLILSVLILGRKYRANQIFGCFLVTAGVILAVASGANGGPLLSGVKFFWPAVMIASAACQAAASIIKEFVFIDGARRLEGKRPDIFVVNSFGSGFQALFVFLLLPFLSNLKGIPFAELPTYINHGAACFLNIGGNLNDCHGAPLLPLLYITLNMAFNISVLNLVKMSTALVASLTSTLAVPLSIYVLSLPLPYLPEGTGLSTSFLIGAATLVLGLLLYNLPQKSADQVKKD